MEMPKPPEPQFQIRGVSFWPDDVFGGRRLSGPWSERKESDVYGATPKWARALAKLFGARA